MKRFYRAAEAAAVEGGWQVELDGRGVRTVGGRAQVVATQASAALLAAEWSAQGETIDPASFVLRDLADYAIDVIAPEPPVAIDDLLRYGETDTLCYRADPGDPLAERQAEVWEPLLRAAEVRWDMRFTRVHGIIHQPQPPATLARLRGVLTTHDAFTLAALRTMANLAASLTVALLALEPDADASALWHVAELEAEWQADLWGRDAEAEARQTQRLATFVAAQAFARAAARN